MTLERLEPRELMAVLTDVSQYAQQFPRHRGATEVFLNFDGGTVPTDPVNNPKGATKSIFAFEGEAQDADLNRDRDIQNILFQVSEVFAPFDVEVERIYGAGHYSTDAGSTTIFIGADLANSNFPTPQSYRDYGSLTVWNINKVVYAQTPGAGDDSPKPGYTPNTHPYDVAFVDPVQGGFSGGLPGNFGQSYGIAFSLLMASLKTERDPSNPSQPWTFDIKRSIAHEVGHTLGLEHVRTDGNSDPKALGTGRVNDVMAYDAPNVYFANQNLTLTAINNNGLGGYLFNAGIPSYSDTSTKPATTRRFVTQDSFAYLKAVVGSRPSEATTTIADPAAVDTFFRSYQDGTHVNLDTVVGYPNALIRPGDYHVYDFTQKTTQTQITVIPTTMSPYFTLKPVVMVYDASGQDLVAYATAVAPGFPVTVNVNSYAIGNAYKVVVGSYDGTSMGAYTVVLGRSSLHVVSNPGTLQTSASSAVFTPAAAPSNAKPMIGGIGAPSAHASAAPHVPTMHRRPVHHVSAARFGR